MDLFKELMIQVLSKQDLHITLNDRDIQKLIGAVNVELLCALKEIRTILEDDSFTDFECVEKIVCVFEELGSDAGTRHDFG